MAIARFVERLRRPALFFAASAVLRYADRALRALRLLRWDSAFVRRAAFRLDLGNQGLEAALANTVRLNAG